MGNPSVIRSGMQQVNLEVDGPRRNPYPRAKLLGAVGYPPLTPMRSIIMISFVTLCILMGPFAGDVLAGEVGSPVKAIYGFSRKHHAMQGKTPEQMAYTLNGWGVTAVFGGYDDPALVATLHDRGIRIFAEVALFVGKNLWKRYPHSRPILSTGVPMAPEGWYYGVNPVIPGIRHHTLKKFQGLIERFPVDGVWLDFIRWPCRWEKPDPQLLQTSFDPFTLESFQKDTGIHIPSKVTSIPDRAQWILEHHREEWTRWKCQQITEFVKQVREILKRAPRTILLGLFGVPWRSLDFDGAIRHIIAQDYRALSAHVDIFSPMVYHKLCGKDVPWIAEVTTWVWHETGKPVWPIVQAMDEPKPLKTQELRQVVKTALSASGSHGAIIFDHKALSPEKIKVVQEVFGGGDTH